MLAKDGAGLVGLRDYQIAAVLYLGNSGYANLKGVAFRDRVRDRLEMMVEQGFVGSRLVQHSDWARSEEVEYRLLNVLEQLARVKDRE